MEHGAIPRPKTAFYNVTKRVTTVPYLGTQAPTPDICYMHQELTRIAYFCHNMNNRKYTDYNKIHTRGSQ